MSKLSHSEVLIMIQGGLVVSCQPVDDGPMDQPAIVAAMAQAAIVGGAVGVRIEGVQNLKATRPMVTAPIIAIVKRDLPESAVRITPFLADIDQLAAAGADIIAVDGTDRERPVAVVAALERIHAQGCLAMADCSTLAEGLYCQQLGFDIIGSTMSGYTGGELPVEPDYQLVKDLKSAGCYVMAEGRYNSPALAKSAMQMGADCVTVGSALTRLEHMVSWFAVAVQSAKE
ncbi:N-acetylmannosamine-6-phosphate 2-epimerase [[Haemophilus] ducreyi]|uniref:Putative N-acetylmannosamine-6-phosphate 2-epimerase n=2 Tax=Haemophilus ducreyi TaxID=730 RepID=NANE_HAEDU|nr:N-acetylmannosamine-6-phosphate 2-epimerase [[Haemophilus] ducreyi]Q7VKN0.1 RecName: Full=Putative N-acetylmannosamine-6-phosphate 2-epimerase; AltName: Full=ManNAc-6-P epimerase [[Haemophilus] ducreyi 35000HP]AAP96593.1 putative N-acetylmannosamine-6-P epimerase [[Haemophilus] ducreyi 35000HP]AKO31437.1 N-acetylmannosamine-6-phosphate 2-epimerase [[Haemophilus] ducreyi]AKO32891.1 N-acetylmannosamine-6-phosphate 2-epimerase [[Haemophilus] ducreyi]AKO34338.1 N-acetylmannosamine-6-phosphate 2